MFYHDVLYCIVLYSTRNHSLYSTFSDVSQMEGAGWATILAILQVPDLDKDKFIVEALTQGCYLLLYAYILQQLPMSRDINDELESVGHLVFWTTKAKPKLVTVQQFKFLFSVIIDKFILNFL